MSVLGAHCFYKLRDSGHSGENGRYETYYCYSIHIHIVDKKHPDFNQSVFVFKSFRINFYYD